MKIDDLFVIGLAFAIFLAVSMFLWPFLRLLLPPKPPQKDNEESKRKIIESIVGKYTTKEDIKNRFNKIKNYKF